MRLVIADQLTAFFLAHLIVGFIYIHMYHNHIVLNPNISKYVLVLCIA